MDVPGGVEMGRELVRFDTGFSSKWMKNQPKLFLQDISFAGSLRWTDGHDFQAIF